MTPPPSVTPETVLDQYAALLADRREQFLIRIGSAIHDAVCSDYPELAAATPATELSHFRGVMGGYYRIAEAGPLRVPRGSVMERYLRLCPDLFRGLAFGRNILRHHRDWINRPRLNMLAGLIFSALELAPAEFREAPLFGDLRAACLDAFATGPVGSLISSAQDVLPVPDLALEQARVELVELRSSVTAAHAERDTALASAADLQTTLAVREATLRDQASRLARADARADALSAQIADLDRRVRQQDVVLRTRSAELAALQVIERLARGREVLRLRHGFPSEESVLADPIIREAVRTAQLGTAFTLRDWWELPAVRAAAGRPGARLRFQKQLGLRRDARSPSCAEWMLSELAALLRGPVSSPGSSSSAGD